MQNCRFAESAFKLCIRRKRTSNAQVSDDCGTSVMFHDILPCHGTTQQFIDPFTYVFKVSSQSAGIMLRMKNGSGQFRQLSADEWTLLRQAQDPAKAIQHVAMILRPKDAADRKSFSLSILETTRSIRPVTLSCIGRVDSTCGRKSPPRGCHWQGSRDRRHQSRHSSRFTDAAAA